MSQHAQVGCVANRDPWEIFATGLCRQQKEPLQARSIRHNDVPQGRQAQLQAPQSVADQVEAHIRLACDDGEDLQDWTPVEQERKVSSSRWGKVAVRGRAAVVGELPGADVQAGERGAAEERGQETDVERPRGGW